MPSWANAVLHEIRSASVSDVVVPSPHASPPKLVMVADVWGRGSTVGDGTDVSAAYLPDASAAAAVMSLNVEPGAYVSLVVVFRSGLPSAARSCLYAAPAAAVSCDASAFGS